MMADKEGKMKMIWIRRVIAVMMCYFLVSCTTFELWDDTNPRAFVALSKTKVNEEELKAKGLSYKVDPNGDFIYVKKNKLQKAGDYAIRAFGTPVTVVIDTVGTTILVVGIVAYGAVQASLESGEPLILSH